MDFVHRIFQAIVLEWITISFSKGSSQPRDRTWVSHIIDRIFKSRDITLPSKVHLVKAMFFPVVMYGCESWTIKKAKRRRIDLLNCGVKKTLESPLDCREIQPVHSEGEQPWVFFGRNDAKTETPVLWPPHVKS